MIYLDNAASTPIYPEVLEDLNQSLRNDFANPSSKHKLGSDLQVKIIEAKFYFLKSLGANIDQEFYFTSSATESNNTVIKGLKLKTGDSIFFSEGDHKSIVGPCEDLGKNGIILKKILHLKNGNISIASEAADSTVKLIILSLVNNQSGNMARLSETVGSLKSLYPNAHIHIDAVQAYGKIPFKLTTEIDSVSITSHKIGGPKGIAGLYLKKGHKINPLILGGGQQNNFRSGTESYPLTNAFFWAAKISTANLDSNLLKIQAFHEKTKTYIKELIPTAQFPFEDVSPYILCLIIPKIPSDVLIRHLEVKDIYLSSTSACSSKIKGFNPTLNALNIDPTFHKNVLRISFGAQTTEEELNKFYEIFHAVWSELAHLVK